MKLIEPDNEATNQFDREIFVKEDHSRQPLRLAIWSVGKDRGPFAYPFSSSTGPRFLGPGLASLGAVGVTGRTSPKNSRSQHVWGGGLTKVVDFQMKQHDRHACTDAHYDVPDDRISLVLT